MIDSPSLARKLGFKPGLQVAFVNPPDGVDTLIGEENLRHVDLVRSVGSEVDIALFFVRSAEELDRQFPVLASAISKAGMLWVAWPKKSSGVASDLTFDVVQRAGLGYGLVDTKICAIDDIWSG